MYDQLVFFYKTRMKINLPIMDVDTNLKRITREDKHNYALENS